LIEEMRGLASGTAGVSVRVRCRRINPQQSPKYPQKSPTYPQKSPVNLNVEMRGVASGPAEVGMRVR